jgi:hypothetical protein
MRAETTFLLGSALPGIHLLRCKNEKQSCLLFLSACFKKHPKPSCDWQRPALFEPRRSSGTTDRGKAS